MFVTSGTQPLVRSYLFLRKCIGIIGVALPFVLIIGKIILESPGISSSISSYYYSVMRDVFVGSLWAIAVFLICYRYDTLDDIASTCAGMCAIGVALLPTTPDSGATQQQSVIGLAHTLFASCFFLLLALMAIFLFRRTDQKNPPYRKRQRDAVYLTCGIAILACVVLSALIILIPNLPVTLWLQPLHPIFWLEAVSIFAFGAAWFVKGETLGILKDKEQEDRNEQKS
jgi:hypothetical protein